MLASTRNAIVCWCAMFFIASTAVAQPASRGDQEQALLSAAKALADKQLAAEACQLYVKFLDRFADSKSAPQALESLCRSFQQDGREREAVVACLARLANNQPDSPLALAVWKKIESEQLLGWLPGTAPKRVQATKDVQIEVALSTGQRTQLPKYRLFHVPLPPIAAGIWWSSGRNPWSSPEHANRLPGQQSQWRKVEIEANLCRAAPSAPSQNFGGGFFNVPHVIDRQFGGNVLGIEAESPVDVLNADLSTPGLYVLEQEIEGLKKRQVFKAESFGIVCRRSAERTMVWAIDPFSGRPLAGVQVSLLEIDPKSNQDIADPFSAKMSTTRKRGLGKTDAQGVLKTDVELPATLVAESGREVQICQIEDWFGGGEPTDAGDKSVESRVYITTDRPIYRPGQMVNFKAIRRDYKDYRPQRPRRETVRVEIRDDDGRVLHDSQHTWNAFGSLSGSFRLADEPRLGLYHIVVHVERPDGEEDEYDEDIGWEKYWSGEFVIEAYRKPQIQVTVHAAQADPEDKRRRATIEANYYIGGPVPSADVEWTVHVRGSAFSGDYWQTAPFADPRRWFYRGQHEMESDHFGGALWQPEVQVAQGKGKTGKDGSLEIDFAAAKTSLAVQYEVRATVRDLARVTATGSGTFDSRASGLAVEVGTDRLFYEPGDKISAGLRVTNADGSPVGGREVRLVAFLNESSTALEFESFATRTVRTDGAGNARVELTAPKSGWMRLRAQASEGEQSKVESRCDLWIAGEAATSALLDGVGDPFGGGFGGGIGGGVSGGFGGGDPSGTLDVLADRRAYAVGETARLMVRTEADSLTALVCIEGRGFVATRIWQLQNRHGVFELPVEADFPQHLQVAILAYDAGKFYGGATELYVYPTSGILDIRVATDQKQYAPRETAKITLDVRDAEGKPAAAEFELGIVDASLFALADEQSIDPRIFFYAAGRQYTLSQSSLNFDPYFDMQSRFGFGGFGGMGGGGFGGGGGGGAFGGGFGGSLGGSGGAQAPFVTSVIPTVGVGPLAATETRKSFADTFFWSAHVEVGPDGKAELSVRAPDTLAKWRIVARAVSGDDRFGLAKSSVVTRKDVMVRLAAPRFYTEGDRGLVSTIVRNDLKQRAEFRVRLSGEGAGEVIHEADGEATGNERRITVDAGGEERLDWTVRANQGGTLRLRAEALSTAASDAMQLDVPVRPFGVERRLSRTGMVDKQWSTSVAIPADAKRENATLELVVGPASSVAVRQALPYLAEYPYGCVEQTMSRFLPAVVASRAMKRLGIEHAALAADLPTMVDLGLQRLYGFQHDDGGWGWWKHDETDTFMTIYVVYGLLVAKQAGYAIDDETLNSGLEAVAELDHSAFGLYVRKLGGEDVSDMLQLRANAVKLVPGAGRRGDNDDPFGPAPRQNQQRKQPNVDALTLAYLVLAGEKQLAKWLPAKLPQDGGPDTIRAQALVLMALASVDRRDSRIAPLVEWLMLERKGGSWHSTLDTAYAVMALAELAAGETMPPVEVELNGRPLRLADGRAVLAGPRLAAGENRIVVRQASGDARLYAAVQLRYFSTKLDALADETTDEGEPPMRITRRVERAWTDDGELVWEALATGAKVAYGDQLRMVVQVESTGAERVMIEAPIAAGTEAHAEKIEDADWWGNWFGRRELRDDRVSAAARELYDTHEFEFRLRPTLPGTYQILPASVFEMYDPAQHAVSKAFRLTVIDDAESP